MPERLMKLVDEEDAFESLLWSTRREGGGCIDRLARLDPVPPPPESVSASALTSLCCSLAGLWRELSSEEDAGAGVFSCERFVCAGAGRDASSGSIFALASTAVVAAGAPLEGGFDILLDKLRDFNVWMRL